MLTLSFQKTLQSSFILDMELFGMNEKKVVVNWADLYVTNKRTRALQVRLDDKPFKVALYSYLINVVPFSQWSEWNYYENIMVNNNAIN